MSLHSIDHAQLQLQHLKEKEAGLLNKLGLLKNQTSSGDHDIEGATRRAQYQLADLQQEIARFKKQPAAPVAVALPAPPAPSVKPSKP